MVCFARLLSSSENITSTLYFNYITCSNIQIRALNILNMSSAKKRQTRDAVDKDVESDGDMQHDIEEEMEEDEFVSGQSVQVDFDARNPEDHDYHGIRKLLQQLLLKANVNISELSDTIISQNYVGSVIKQVEDPAEMDSDDDGEDDVFGLTTVINMSDKKELGCVKQLGDLLRDRCKENAPGLHSHLTKILSDDQLQLGLVFNERFINLPPQLSVPALHSLWKECERAVKKKMRFNFTHYILFLKAYKPLDLPGTEDTWVFVNPEEELFQQEAEFKFSYSVKAERDTANSGWGDGDQGDEDYEMEPFRIVVVLSKDSISEVMSKMDEQFTNT